MKDCALKAPEWLARSAVYQINPRTFCPEGTLRAVTAQLPFLASLGFGVMYLCPIFQADASDNSAYWSDRQRASQTNNPKNPYRMRDYYTIDEEYGTLDDLREFINQAHALGMRVLLDLVYLHIGPNAPVLKAHPDFARQDAEGQTLLSVWRFPYLDFSSPGLREYLWGNMIYYIGALDADGFRCDVGDQVPLDFWAEGRRRMRLIKPDAALINEGHNRESLRLAFDSMYCFDWHQRLYDVFVKKMPASRIREGWEKQHGDLPRGSLLLRDMDNHDTVTDWPARTEQAAGHAGMELILLLNFLIDGIPMVYCGNELGDTTALSMFANRFFPGRFTATPRAIASEDYSLRRQAIIRTLTAWKKESDVLRFGETEWLSQDAPDQVIAFRRALGNSTITCIANCSDAPCQVSLAQAPRGEKRLEAGCERIGPAQFSLAPYGYLALENK